MHQEEDLYSAPRTFDIATLLVITFAYAFLFAGLRLLDAPPMLFAFISGLISWVGIAQALFHGMASPRQVSVVAGIVFFEFVNVYTYSFPGSRRSPVGSLLCCAVVGCVPGGIGCGYMAGVLVGGVFMLAEHVRKSLAKLRRFSRTSPANEKESPWSEDES